MRILAIIPARGGSKGIKKKNIQPLGSQPLITWTIDFCRTLLDHNLIDRAIVSTDDPEIANLAAEYNADVPFLRPQRLSGDKSPASDYVSHAYEYMDSINELYDASLILQPTSPFRSLSDFQSAIHLFTSQSHNSLISCYRDDYVCDDVSYFEDGNNLLKPVSANHSSGSFRQDHRPRLIRNGALYLTKREFFTTHHRLICDSPAYVLMDRVNSINIDNLDDLEYARYLACK